MVKEIIADLHTHTDVSKHAYSSIYENIQAAKQAGLCAVAITNHAPALPDGATEGHFRNLRIIPRYVDDILVLRGAECNILHNGEVDLSEDTLKNRLDICIASLHEDVCGKMTKEQVTKAYLKIAENPNVDIIGHCGTAGYEFDWEPVIRKWKDFGKVVEVNEGTFKVRPASVNNCREILRLCKQYGVRVCANSDAHFCTNVGQLSKSLSLLQELEFPQELVINASKKTLYRWLEDKCVVELVPEE